MKLAFLDTETLSLEPGPSSIWDLAIILREEPGSAGSDEEHAWQMRGDLSMAEAGALKVGRYYERCRARGHNLGYAVNIGDNGPCEASETDLAARVASMLSGAVLIGANVGSFDAAHLDAWLRARGECLSANYHYIDIGSLVAGWMAGKSAGFRDASHLLRGLHSKSCDLPLPDDQPPSAPMLPLRAKDAARFAGLNPDDYELHTALGDARMARDTFDRVMAP